MTTSVESPSNLQGDKQLSDANTRRAFLTKALTVAGGSAAFFSALPGKAAEIPREESLPRIG